MGAAKTRTEMRVLQAAVLATLLSCCIRLAGGDRGEAANAQVPPRDWLKCSAPLEIQNAFSIDYASVSVCTTG